MNYHKINYGEMNSLRKKNDKMILVKRNPTLDEQRIDLIPYWHPTRNMNISIKQFNLDSNAIVWWKCPEDDDHEWQDSIKKTGKRKKPFWCPMCAKVKVVISNCLATTNPELIDRWHPTKNGEITPFDITNGTKESFWWKCPEGGDHEWQTSAKKMVKGSGDCMVCKGRVITTTNNLLYKYPKIAEKIHQIENSNNIPEKIYYRSTKKYWWICDINQKHKWEATIASVLKDDKCRICTKYENSLALYSPEIAKEWHPTKNGSLTAFDVSKSTYKKVWWMCRENNHHKWLATVESRQRGLGSCPECKQQINSLAVCSPLLAKEWHPNKNGSLTALGVTKSSNIKVWWRCVLDKNHEWKASIANRQNGTSCPICSKEKRYGNHNALKNKDLYPISEEESLIVGWNKSIVPRQYKAKILNLLNKDKIFEASQEYLKLAYDNGEKNPSKVMIEFEKIIEGLNK